MSGFAIVNLKEVADSAGERAPGIDGRFARSNLDSQHLGISYFRYQPSVPKWHTATSSRKRHTS